MFEAVSKALPLANLFLHGQWSICIPPGYPPPTRALGCRRAVGSSIMPLLALPAEILDLILQNLDAFHLWNVYNSCAALRVASARSIFRSVEIRFDGAQATDLNTRCFPPSSSRLLAMVAQWSSHVRTMDVWGDEDFLEPGFFDVLATLDRLRAFSISYPPRLGSFQTLLVRLADLPSLRSLSVDFISPRIWTAPMTFHHLRQLHISYIEHEPGLCVLPALPVLETLALNFCCYCLECPRQGQGPCALLQFQRLPQLRSLSIAGAQRKSISCGLDLHQILASLGWDLEELHLLDCEFVAEVPRPVVAFPALRRVQLLESISGLAAFGSAEVPSSAEFTLRISHNNLDGLADWSLVWRLLQRCSVLLSLPRSGIHQWPPASTSRLSQVMSLPQVRVEGPP
ncbi:hypothetical protein AFCA_009595 [Aspergillus flavus]|nr:hypothetical protein AFCA_009595 [Aspergillus flavus]